MPCNNSTGYSFDCECNTEKNHGNGFKRALESFYLSHNLDESECGLTPEQFWDVAEDVKSYGCSLDWDGVLASDIAEELYHVDRDSEEYGLWEEHGTSYRDEFPYLSHGCDLVDIERAFNKFF